MRKFIDWPGGDRDELSPLTYEEFTKFDLWVGDSDTAFKHFKSHNHFVELSDFSADALESAVMNVELGEPGIDWTVKYGDSAL